MANEDGRPPHGTVRRYYQEYQRKNETPCDLCRAARIEHDRNAPNAEQNKRKNADKHEIRRRSRLRLSREYPERYAEIVAEETDRFAEEQIMKMFAEIQEEK